jgi:hypothetical protein
MAVYRPSRHARDADDPSGALLTFLRERLPHDDYAKAEELLVLVHEHLMSTANDEPPPFPGRPRPGGAEDRRYAMDEKDPIVRMQDIRTAEAEVEPYVGPVLAMDSAGAVFREAIRRLVGDRYAGVPVSGLPALWREVKRNRGGNAGNSGGGGTIRIHDPRAAASFVQRQPDAARIRVMG